MMPLTECDIKCYLDEVKQKEIFEKMTRCIRNINSKYDGELSFVYVEFLEKNAFFICDEEGDVVSGECTPGSYFKNAKTIGICAENLSKFVNDFMILMYREGKMEYRSNAYDLCDLVLLHEYVHAYQHMLEHKNLKRGDRLLEEEANRRAVIIWAFGLEIDDDLISFAVTFFESESEFGFGDNFSVDELITQRKDIKYLMNMFF